jgi:hypothetical protein
LNKAAESHKNVFENLKKAFEIQEAPKSATPNVEGEKKKEGE